MPETNQGQYSRIHFRVWAKTLVGQKVGVGGSVSTLGNFDISRVVHLVTTPESYPVWYTLEPIVVPRGRSVTFSFCIIEGGISKAFESANVRTLTPDRVDMVVEETFNPQKLVGVGSDSEQNILEGLSEIRSESNQSLKSMESDFADGSTLFIACYHLPLTITRSAVDDSGFKVEWNHSLISSAGDLSKFSINMSTYWVGTVSVEGPELTVSEQECLTSKLTTFKCVPIFLSSEIVRDGYYGYCKRVLWPCFHNVERIDHMHSAWRADKVTAACERDHEHHHAGDVNGLSHQDNCKDMAAYDFWTNDTFADWYTAYNQLNNVFAKKLKELCKDKDIVWVHDYHLCLLPGQLREIFNNLKMIFFLHIPFPTSQIFRSLPTSMALLSSIVKVNVVGFHTFDYSRHFLHATRRMLGARSHTVEGGIMAVTIHGRRLLISMSQVSIEPSFLRKSLANPDTFVETKRLKARFDKKRVIVAIETCQKLSGCELQLEAFRLFLEENRGKPCNVIMCLAVLRPNSRPEDEEHTSQTLRKMVQHINDTYGKEGEVLVDYSEHSSMNISQRVAMWLSGDIFLRTSVREGLNLMPMEYLFVRKELEDAGVIIASEFSVCSTLLNGSIKINPFDTRKIADALHIALSMSRKEKDSRRSRDLEIVCSHPSDLWAQQILADLNTACAVRGGHGAGNARSHKLSRGFSREMPMSSINDADLQECLPLSIPRFLNAYDNAILTRGLIKKGSRVFIFDYGGTLISNEKFDIYMKQTLSAITGRLPSPAVLESIRTLSDDPNNCVLILTHITRDKMMGLFDDMPNVSIACSNGVVTTWGANLIEKMSDNCYDEDLLLRNRSRANSEVFSNDDCVAPNAYEGSFDELDVESSVSDVEGDMEAVVHSQQDEEDGGVEHRRTRSEESLNSQGEMTERLSGLSDQSQTGKDEEEDANGIFRDAGSDDGSSVVYYPFTPASKKNSLDMLFPVGVIPRKWEHKDMNTDWKIVNSIAIPIIHKFTIRTNGSCISPRVPGVCWSYFGADPEWGEKQAVQLTVELETALVNYDVKIAAKKGHVEVIPRVMHKGKVVTEFLKKITGQRAGKLPSFVLVAGADPGDSDIFDSVYNQISECRPQDGIETCAAFSVHVGSVDNYSAGAFVPGVDDMQELLVALAASDSTDKNEAEQKNYNLVIDGSLH
mmetsp:Transcript_2410/g.4333  ORF Transcript_2410/g.4333 Transcript_2410/m.4333 type:complete len:1177 (+) Transcript_2410:176-3706(+)